MTSTNSQSKPPKIPLGPEPTLLSRKQVDALYETLRVVQKALTRLQVDFIVTGGSLLGAIRQHSILFCDDDIDMAILDYDGTVYEQVVLPNLQQSLDAVIREENELDPTKQTKNPESYAFQIKPWEGGDRIRPKRMNTVFVDLFVLRPYRTEQDLLRVIGQKRNGQAQSQEYIDSVLEKLTQSAYSQGETESLYPCWQFSTRKAVEMWAKEVYRESELFPLDENLKMGPLTHIKGPAQPVRLLKRAFGEDCFHVYYQSVSHVGGVTNNTNASGNKKNEKETNNEGTALVSSNQDLSEHQGSQQDKEASSSKEKKRNELKPLVSAAGTWEQNPKVPLEAGHYLPMQPIPKASRRHTSHNRETLLEYLKVQSELEGLPFSDTGNDHAMDKDGGGTNAHELTENHDNNDIDSSPPPNRTIYMDGVFDLFHIGHLNAIQQCARLGTRVILGVTGDQDAAGYKRPPIVPQEERVAIVQALQCVRKVVCPCPLIVTKEFMEEQGIDLVVHGFANDADAEKQNEFFAIPMSMNKFQRIEYYKGLSTTDRIEKIQNQAIIAATAVAGPSTDSAGHHGPMQPLLSPSNQATPKPATDETNQNGGLDKKKSQWFGYCVAQATNNASTIPFDPIPLSLRMVMEPHIDKARINRTQALDAIRHATGAEQYDRTMKDFTNHLMEEGQIHSLAAIQKLRSALLISLGLDPNFDLSKLHLSERGHKDKALCQLTQSYSSFQSVFDDFVRTTCVPVLASKYPSWHMNDDDDNDGGVETVREIYYQSFPCLRIIQPDEFSIGPHADVAYGHHPCSINFYIPLTAIGGSSSLFLESRVGSEDWHPIEGDGQDQIKYFAGASCMHWTTENKTDRTRVSLDFRMIVGPMFDALACCDGDDNNGGKIDVYRTSKGYYSKCVFQGNNDSSFSTNTISGNTNDHHTSGIWERIGPLLPPDARTGFPWTVKVWKKQQQQKQERK
ncbi:unnamed protein product [Cylindrotheca closterium]|uniref:ethanolamine-phosphate cytidylyltransferase n=1 Tax=Cylindrotheca closterium TaxID=2856 RepID=A0AAD2CMD0_9STRA|nr:unnamed protein product [Cylindrotheca closterium]